MHGRGINAAMAYGFASQEEKAKWIVFDLGGGTLDVSLVVVRSGQLKVPEEGHGGDTLLGGSKFDRELMDYVLAELRKTYALAHFEKDNEDYKSAWVRLTLAAELAKIELSTSERAVIQIDGQLCKDENREDVFVEVPIERGQYERLIAADVEKAVMACRNLLTNNNLSVKEIDGLILLGGPTKTPYLQKILAERLGIPLFKDIDPMTAVACDAAVYASTLELPEELAEEDSSVDAKLVMQYPRMSQLPEAHVMGMIEEVDTSVGGFTIRFEQADCRWQSPNISISEEGDFEAELSLIDDGGKKRLSAFTATAEAFLPRTLQWY